MTTQEDRVKALIERLGADVERIKLHAPNGYHVTILLSHPTAPAAHMLIGDLKPGEAATKISELIDGPHKGRTVEVADPGQAGLAMARHMRAGDDLVQPTRPS